MPQAESRKMPRPLLLFALAVFALLPNPIRAETNPMDVFADGVEAMDAGDHAKAVTLFDQAAALSPDNPEFVYYKALALEKMGRDEEALSILNQLLSAHPKEYRKAYFDIAAIKVKQKQLAAALCTLQKAIASDPGDARARMEAGVVARDMGDHELAVQYFEQAAQLNPDLTAQARYMIAVVHMDKEDFDLAESLFNQVIQAYPCDPAGKAAVQALIALEKVRKARKAWYSITQFSWGYDDNVSNQPLEPLAAVTYPEKTDYFQNLFVMGAYRLVNEKERRLGGGLSFHHLGYRDLPANNILSYSPFLFGEWDLAPLHLRTQYDYTYYYTGGSDSPAQDAGWYLTFHSPFDKLKTHQVACTSSLDEAHGMRTQLDLVWLQKDYFDLSPDADGFTLGLVQSKAFGDSGRVARAGYTYYYESSEADNFSYWFHQGTLGFTSPLAYGITGDAAYSLVFTDYEENPLLWVGGDRKDATHRVTALVSKEFTDWLQGNLTYIFNSNDSNVTRAGIDEYEYRRNVVLATMSLSF